MQAYPLAQGNLLLKMFLYILDLEIYLPFVGQLTNSLPINCAFDHVCFKNINRKSKKVLMQGLKMGNLYMPPVIVLEAHFSTKFRATPLRIWHQGLGAIHM